MNCKQIFKAELILASFFFLVQLVVYLTQGSWTSSNKTIAGLTDLQVRTIVDQALAKYDADKTGLVDYALESSGESV